MSIIAASGPINWKDVKLPAGRSRGACYCVVRAALEEAQTVELGDNKNASTIKKRGPRGPRGGKSNTNTSYGKRKRSEDEVDGTEDVSDNETEAPSAKEKKPKTNYDNSETETEGKITQIKEEAGDES